MTDETDFQVAPGTVETDFDDGLGLGVAIGHRFDQGGGLARWRLEGEVSARGSEVDTHRLNGGAPLAGSAGDLDSIAFMVNGYAEFGGGGQFNPYLGAGLGFAEVNAQDFGVNAIPSVLDDEDTVFAYQLIAGVGYAVSPRTELFAEYRWFATDDPDVTTSAGAGAVDTSIEYQTNNILLGVRLNF